METITKLRKIVKELGDEYRIHSDYSGRGMFGRTCLGISGPDANKIIAASGKYRLTEVRTDTLGYNHIVYWPYLK